MCEPTTLAVLGAGQQVLGQVQQLQAFVITCSMLVANTSSSLNQTNSIA